MYFSLEISFSKIHVLLLTSNDLFHKYFRQNFNILNGKIILETFFYVNYFNMCERMAFIQIL